MTFAFNRVSTDDRLFRPAYDRLAADGFAALGPVAPWGAFAGLFGVGSNEFFLVLSGEPAALEEARRRIDALPGMRVTEADLLEATVRPVDAAPLRREGLYVFRFFDIDNADIDEVARLSAAGWTAFEHSDRYRAEPQGLFCRHGRPAGDGRMLLVTWYDGLGSWETSRQPEPGARENFQRRALLTKRTVAYATRLITG